MRITFNEFSNLLKSPTKLLVEEIDKSIRDIYAEGKGKTVWDALPSIEKVEVLIRKGAKVNTPVDHLTALGVCARQYRSAMDMASGHGGLTLDGHEVTPAEWKVYAERYLEVAKALIDAGADPRIGTVHNLYGGGKFIGSTPMDMLTGGLKNPALVKDFTDLLATASIFLPPLKLRTLEELKKPKPPQP